MESKSRLVILALAVLVAIAGGLYVYRGGLPAVAPAEVEASGAAPQAEAVFDAEDKSSPSQEQTSDAPSSPQALDEIVLGDPNAPVTMIEYASLTCPHCGAFHNETLPILKKEYIDTGKLKLYLRPFPFDGVATAGSMLVYCVAPEMRLNFLTMLFERQSVWLMSSEPIKELEKLARFAGLSEMDFRVCLKDETIFNGIREIQKAAHEVQKVQSTPTFFVRGDRIEGNQSVDAFRDVINKYVPSE
jgi:protein-disulfide isomerase